MKLLYLVFRGFEKFNGISKKMTYQADAFRKNGLDVRCCYLEMKEDGTSLRMVDNGILENYGRGIISKFRKRFSFATILKYISEESINNVYIRYEHNANPFFISALKQLSKKSVRVVLEIPTYPYDKEYRKQGSFLLFHLWIDRCFRLKLAKYIYRIVTFSDDIKIFGVPTIRISNGIDFESVRLRQHATADQTRSHLNLLGVAEIHLWHGFDRLIKGLGEYYRQSQTQKVFFHIVGYGAQAYLQQLKKLVESYNIQDYVFFHGPQYGVTLDSFFDNADIGVASLARHRSRITTIKTLKNREYAARGIPFVYSEIDADFESMPYILKIPANESPIDIVSLIHFYNELRLTAQEIRDSISNLSWEKQMQIVINEAFI